MSRSNILKVCPVIPFLSNNNFTIPRTLGINNSIHIPNNELRQKILLASKNPRADIPFDDVLAHTICFEDVAEDVIPFTIPKTVKKDKK